MLPIVWGFCFCFTRMYYFCNSENRNTERKKQNKHSKSDVYVRMQRLPTMVPQVAQIHVVVIVILFKCSLKVRLHSKHCKCTHSFTSTKPHEEGGYPCFTDAEISSERRSHSPKVRQLVRGAYLMARWLSSRQMCRWSLKICILTFDLSLKIMRCCRLCSQDSRATGVWLFVGGGVWLHLNTAPFLRALDHEKGARNLSAVSIRNERCCVSILNKKK